MEEKINISNVMNLIHQAEDIFLKNGLTVSPSLYYEIKKVMDENILLKQQLSQSNNKIEKIKELCDEAVKNSYTYSSVNHSGILTNATDILQIIDGSDK